MLGNDFYLVKIKFTVMEEGFDKKKSEQYLVNGLTATEVESRIIDEVASGLDNFEVDTIKKEKIAEIFIDTCGETWFKARLGFTEIDEKTGNDKVKPSTYYVKSDSFFGAYNTIKEQMKNTLADWKVVSLAESQVVDMFPLKAKDESETKKEEKNDEE